MNRIGIVSNDPKELGEIVEGQINRAEVVVIAGGVGGAAAEAVRSVLAELGEKKGKTFLVGFAAETADHEANAREKLERKHLDAIAVNDVGGGRGFGTGENALVVLWGKDGRRDLGTADKATLAARLWDTIEELRCS